MEQKSLTWLQIYILFWKNIFNYKGRSTRKELWVSLFINMLVRVLIYIFIGIFYFIGFPVFTIFIYLFSIATGICWISINCRRLHDINLSAKWIFLEIGIETLLILTLPLISFPMLVLLIVISYLIFLALPNIRYTNLGWIYSIGWVFIPSYKENNKWGEYKHYL